MATAPRLGILATHPIQYQAPWFRHLARRFDLQVFFAHKQDAAGQSAAGFDVSFQWDVPLLEGYCYHWLRNVARSPGVAHFGGCDTPEIADIIAADHFDAFFVSGWNKKCFLQAVSACRRRGVPVLMRGDSQLVTRRSRLKMAAKYFPYRWFLNRIDAHLVVGQRNRDYLRHYGVPDERLFFCPHFVDNDFFATRAAQALAGGASAQVRSSLGIPEDAFVFLFVGKFIPRKRPADLLMALERAVQSAGTRDLYAVLVGDGPLRDSLQQMAVVCNGRVRFAGFRNQSELPAYYQAADALVLPSEGSETWGLVVNEAMACGRPCLVSDAVGCGPDLVDHGETGFSFPLGDTAKLAERMLELCELIEQKRQQVLAALTAKMQAYSPSAATDGLETALGSICRRSKSGEMFPPSALEASLK